MADGLFTVQVLTPEETLVDGQARAVVLRSSEGDLTVLDGHMPLVTDVVPGLVRLDQEDGTVRLAVHGGFLQVEKGPVDTAPGEPSAGGTRVTLLAGVAELSDRIDVARAERAQSEAALRVEELRSVGRSASSGPPDGGETSESGVNVELAQAESALRRAEVRLEVAGISTR